MGYPFLLILQITEKADRECKNEHIQIADVQPLLALISRLVIAISTGGNYLLNIGPDHNGRILPVFEERLRELGSFVNAHNESIFATKPWIYQNDSDSAIW